MRATEAKMRTMSVFPCEVDQKYVTQTVPRPQLPEELVQRLEEGAEK
jgi:hypothetical protein